MCNKKPRIVLSGPREGQVVGSVGSIVVVEGLCDTYEANVQIRVKDATGTVLAAGMAHGGTLGVMAPFRAELRIGQPPESPMGAVEAYEVDMRDGSERENVTLSVRFH